MESYTVIAVIGLYFCLLIGISVFTSRKATNETFFTGNRQSPWYLVAFGMIGASLSGVTFISIPGQVGNNEFSYFQLVLGYLLGYGVISYVLLPLYYRMNLISIYTFLEERYGQVTYKLGSFLFLISQMMGASLRLFLAAAVLQIAFFDSIGVSFNITVLVTIFLIWGYTYRGGIKTIVWTDTLQTFFMLLSLIITIYIVSKELHIPGSEMIETIVNSDYSTVFFWDWKESNFFVKQFFSGAFIAICMTGLDQNMMQKNLTCRNLKEAQKNVNWFSVILIPVNLLFLSLGALLYLYVQEKGLTDLGSFSLVDGRYMNTDDLYPILAIKFFPTFAGIVFLLGITAAAFSSADSALTSLTTSFCIDFLAIEKREPEKQKKVRLMTHVVISMLMAIVIIVFKIINDRSVITAVFIIAGYTYGPLLGLFSFGLFTRKRIIDKVVPVVLVSPILTYLVNAYSEEWLYGYKFGFEIIILNGMITFAILYLISMMRKNAV
ncbi:MAG: sodium:solute symporter [Cyclobacteriaceae bacterium]|nr:sodium:solute symporter [Cyclobacteriaceae bacterium]